MVNVPTPSQPIHTEEARSLRTLRQLVRASQATAVLAALLFTSTLVGCSCSEDKPEKPQVAPAPTPAPVNPKVKSGGQPLTLGHRYPVGPRLVFLPGKGVGAIRFGATVETIERHMEASCDEKTEKRCIYVRQAIEFFLEDGKLARIRASRRDRAVPDAPAKGDQYFGSLRGIVQPKIMMGLHRHIVVEEFGEPVKKESIDPPGPDGQLDKHFYDGIIFEYDKIENGNIVLGGIEVYPSATAKTPGPTADAPTVTPRRTSPSAPPIDTRAH